LGAAGATALGGACVYAAAIVIAMRSVAGEKREMRRLEIMGRPLVKLAGDFRILLSSIPRDTHFATRMQITPTNNPLADAHLGMARCPAPTHAC
jgi:hypothetical protein